MADQTIVTMDQIVDFSNGIGTFTSQVLPLQAAYKLNKIRRQVEKEITFYQDKFAEIANKYAKKDDNGNVVYSEDGSQILIADGKIEECNKAISELSKLEVGIDNCGLKIEDFGDIECTADELETIMPFLA